MNSTVPVNATAPESTPSTHVDGVQSLTQQSRLNTVGVPTCADGSGSLQVKRVYSLTQLKQMYLDSLSPKETKAYNIAHSHLGSSFTLEKSIGYLQWKKEASL